MLAHAVRGAPWEACGLFGGRYGSDLVTEFVPMSNAAASPVIYRLDAQEQLDVETSIEAAGLATLGVMHSHVQTAPYPSATDIADAARFDPLGTMHFVIVSLKRAEPVLRNFRIIDGAVREIPVKVVPNQ